MLVKFRQYRYFTNAVQQPFRAIPCSSDMFRMLDVLCRCLSHLRSAVLTALLSSSTNSVLFYFSLPWPFFVGLLADIFVGLLEDIFVGLLADIFVGLLEDIFVGLLADIFVGLLADIYVGLLEDVFDPVLF